MLIIKKSILFFVVFLFCNMVFSFEWPVKKIEDNSIETDLICNFAENRQSIFCNGLVFSQSGNVFSSDEGKVLVTLNNGEDFYENFHSSLGKAIILGHNDQMISVYGNLSTIIDDLLEKEIPSNCLLGNVNKKNSAGWHENDATLEFQVIDVKNKVVINPFLLLPRIEKIKPVFLGNIFLVNKKGRIYDLEKEKLIPSGDYSIYRTVQKSRMPIKTTVSVNGLIKYTIDYDTLVCNENKLCVSGNQILNFNQIYQNKDQQLLGFITLVKGNNLVSCSVIDCYQTERKLSFIIESR